MLLEAIEVEHRDAQLVAESHRAFDFELEREIELAAVVHAGQPIACGEMQESLRATHDRIREHHRGAQQDQPRRLVDDRVFADALRVHRIVEVVAKRRE